MGIKCDKKTKKRASENGTDRGETRLTYALPSEPAGFERHLHRQVIMHYWSRYESKFVLFD